MRRAVLAAPAALALIAPVPAAGSAASVPAIRAGGPTLVVCKPDSSARVRRIWPGRGPRTTRSRRSRLRLARRCRFRHIQAAVDEAAAGTRILILPGLYREEPSRATPGARDLIAITGERDVQLQGTGKFARDVVVEGDRAKRDVIHAERADGLVVTNLTTEQAARSDIAVAATDGFRLQKLVARHAQHDGVSAASSRNGLYDNVEAYGNGEAGISAAPACRGIEVRDVWSYGNVLGYAGAAGARDSRFVANAAGLSADAAAGCSRWTGNVIASNNRNLFTRERQSYCAATPFARRPKEIVCPQIPVPVGAGLLLRGANGNAVEDNVIYDNWRSGVRLSWVPAAARGVSDPALQFDTSNGNRFARNRVGLRADGARDPNGTDFFWDEEGRGNCWSDNAGPGGAAPTSDPARLPACPRGSAFSAGDPAKLALEVPCATWQGRHNPEPAGCDWFITPAEPR